MAQQYKARSLTATVSEGTLDINTELILHITNDNTSGGDLIIGLEETLATETDPIVIKPGESIKNFVHKTKTLFYKASTGSVAFRFLAVNSAI